MTIGKCPVCGHDMIVGTPTNGDVIRSLSDYDLAEWIAMVLTYHDTFSRHPLESCNKECPLYYCCHDQPSDNIEDWLGMEVKHE